MRRVGIYIRVSTDHQVKDGQSLEVQRYLLMEHIRKHPDMVLAGEYMDDGVSGTKFDQRDELQRLLSDVKDGKIDLVIFTKLDRFFRSVRHLMNTLDFLEQYGVEWDAIQEQHDSTTPTGKLSITIMGAFSELEANMASIRVKDALQHKKLKKEWLNGNLPYGYKLANKHAVPDPEQAEVVRRIFDEYNKNNNLLVLTRNHAHLGCPTTTRGMKNLLKKRVYIGEMYGIADYVEPIVSRETFERAQLSLTRNVKCNSTHQYIFSGLVRCPVCGKRMAGCKSREKWLRYRCNHFCERRCTYKYSHSEIKIEKYLLSTYEDELKSRYLYLKSMKKTDNSSKINNIYHKIDRLKDLYVADLIDMDTYKADLKKYKEELETLEKPIENDAEKIEELLQLNVLEIYHTLTRPQKRRLWGSVIRSITPQPDGTFFVEYL